MIAEPRIVRASRCPPFRPDRLRASSFFSACEMTLAGGSGRPPLGGGGATTLPTYIGLGTPDLVGTTNLTPALGPNVAGDLFVLLVGGRVDTVTTPAGWTLQVGPQLLAGRAASFFTRNTRATGGEVGTVNVPITITPATGGAIGVIYTFRNVRTTAFIEDPSVGGSASNGLGPLPPSITAGGNFRLAIFAAADGNQVAYSNNVTGSTGGTWVFRDTQGSGTGSNQSTGLFTADLPTGGTIAGGSGTTLTDEHVTIGMALVGT